MVRWCWLCLAAVLVSVIVADTAAAARACWLGGPCLELHGGASDLTLTHTHTDIHDMQVKPAHIRLEGASHGEWRACVRWNQEREAHQAADQSDVAERAFPTRRRVRCILMGGVRVRAEMQRR